MRKEIAERKKADKILRELSSRYEAILSAVPDIIVEVNSNKVYTWSNQAGFEFFGKDVLGKEAAFYFEGEQDTYKMVQPLFDGDETMFYIESWQRRKDDEKRLLAWWCRVLKDENGNVTGALSTARDITEHQKMKKKLQRHHDQLQGLVNERTAEITETNEKLRDEITERKIVEVELVRSRQKSLLHTQRTPLAVIEWNTNFEVKEWNPAAEKIFGYRDEEALGCHAEFIIHENAKEHVNEVWQNLLVQKGGMRSTNENITKDGNTIFCEWYNTPLVSESGEVLGVASLVQDVTDVKLAENEIRVKNSFLKILQIAAVAANGATEIKDAFQPILNEICDYTGWPIGHAYIISKDDSNLLEPTTVWHLKDSSRFAGFRNVTEMTKFAKGIGLPGRVLARGKPHWIVDVTRDNNFHRLEIANDMDIKSAFAFPVMVGTKVVAVLEFFSTEVAELNQQFLDIMADVGTQLGRVVERKSIEKELTELNQTLEERVSKRTVELSQINKTLVQEVSERKMAEEALHASEGRLLSLSRATFEGIVFSKNGVFLDCNEQFADIVGYEPDELIGTDGLTLVHPEDRVLARNSITIGSEEPYELRLLCNDNSIKFVEVHGQMMLINGERLRVTAFRDITERKKMEEEIIKIQKLESLGVLAGGIAHDFNNNLQSIVSCVALAKTYANPEDEIYRKLEEAKNVVLQSKSLTQQLLTFSKGGEPVKNTISISKLIKYSANLALSGSNVRCELGIPDDLWSVEADKGQLSQVISNLIINAGQAMPEGGNIKVWAENINVVEKDQIPLQQGMCVKISVVDQGTGISQEHLQNIFDPYFTTKEMGSGLGLATAYSIIKKHEGYITVESEVGVGTTFRIYLPASSKEIRGISAKSEEKRAITALVDKKNEEKPNVSKGKVLLMDDEALIRLFITQHIINLKYEVETAEDGAEAIGLYKRAMESDKPFDAVIMDLTIPGGMGGKETIERLLEIDPEVRAIVASGYADDPIMAEFNKYGFIGVLVKPYEIDELDEVLQKVIKEVS
ncbi:MAG: PAS domain S-box protein [Candidatus Scalindua sp.]|nr:PAS domain S-box protein [Candidatus Scalindua sp.]